jgi:hypothetical protein
VKKITLLFVLTESLMIGSQSRMSLACPTIERCQSEIFAAQRYLEFYISEALSIGEGTAPILKTYREAESYCQINYGGRLPTVRELAIYAQSLGARGIRESKYAGLRAAYPQVVAEEAQMYSDGYQAVEVPLEGDPTQGAIAFYYDGSGYKPPGNDFGNVFFWSSDYLPGGWVPLAAKGAVFKLDGKSGRFGSERYLDLITNSRLIGAVHCISVSGRIGGAGLLSK